jgi:hypothetical protein
MLCYVYEVTYPVHEWLVIISLISTMLTYGMRFCLSVYEAVLQLLGVFMDAHMSLL